MARAARVTRHDDSELEVDYVTDKVKNLAHPTDRVCTFTLRSGRLCSHYLIMLPPQAAELVGPELRAYLLEHVNAAQHTRTCEKVR